MTHKEASANHQYPDRLIMCLPDGLPTIGIWVMTDGKGNLDYTSITREESELLTKLKTKP